MSNSPADQESSDAMSLRERRFGKIVSDNVAGNKGTGVSLIKATKRINEGEAVPPAIAKKSRVNCTVGGRENVENISVKPSGKACKATTGETSGKENRDVTKAIESHVRKLDLGGEDCSNSASAATADSHTRITSYPRC